MAEVSIVRHVKRWRVGLLLSLALVCNALACAPQSVGPTRAGYVFALSAYPSSITLRGAAELIVSVRTAQGLPAEDLPVTFEVEPAWVQSASVVPQVASTKHGTARAVFQAHTTGVVRVSVRVDDATQETRITVSSPPSPQTESE